VPIIRQEQQERVCPECGGRIKYIYADIRPVFSEEARLLEILKDKHGEYIGRSVWANHSNYIVDGEKLNLSVEEIKAADSEQARAQCLTDEDAMRFDSVIKEKYIDRFIFINKEHLDEIVGEAVDYIKEEAKSATNMVVSFSGGKDSTAVSALVMQALGREDIRHIFADTTLELDNTYTYIEEYKRHYPLMPFNVGRNEEDFYKAADEIGAPAVKCRWCCTMYKTGPVNRVFEELFASKKVLTFYGVRKSESVSRSKYSRTEDREDTLKIAGQRLASPIFHWRDCEVWLYILAYNVPFNRSYRKGFTRVGCFNCPNTTARADFMAKLTMPEKSKKWRDFLLGFAQKIGKPNFEEYVDGGFWKTRRGGNGMKTAADVKIKQTNCTTEEYAKVYEINKPIEDWFYDLFKPLGIVSKTLGRKLIGEVLVLDMQTKMPIISIQPFKSDYEHSVKILILNVKNAYALERKIGYQIRKYNACKRCLKCEAVCRSGAIAIKDGTYSIDDGKCSRCQMCVMNKYLVGGCLMTVFLKTREDYTHD